MSVTAMSKVWSSDLPRAEKMILLAYADHADDEGGSVFPAVGRISWKTGYSKRQVIRITQSLVEMGYMTDIGISHFKTSIYKINLESLPPLPPYIGGDKMSVPQVAGKALGDDISDSKGDISDSDSDILSGGGDIAMSPDPSLDPSLNTSLKPYIEGGEDFEEEPEEEPLDPDEVRANMIVALGQVCKGYPNEFKKEECEFWQTAEILRIAGHTVADIETFGSWWTSNGIYPGQPAVKSVLTHIDQSKAGFVPNRTNGANPAAFTDQWNQVMDWLKGKREFKDLPEKVQHVVKMISCGGTTYIRAMREDQVSFYRSLFQWAFRVYINMANNVEQDYAFCAALKQHYDTGHTAGGIFTEPVNPFNLKDSYQKFCSTYLAEKK
jgi:hypothetical protein